MDTDKDFIFGDLSGIDFTDSEEISINVSSQKASKSSSTSVPIKSSLPVMQPTNVLLNNSNTAQSAPSKILTVKQAAQYLQLRTETILRKIYAGELSAFKVGRIWRIKQDQIDDYLNKNIHGAKDQ